MCFHPLVALEMMLVFLWYTTYWTNLSYACVWHMFFKYWSYWCISLLKLNTVLYTTVHATWGRICWDSVQIRAFFGWAFLRQMDRSHKFVSILSINLKCYHWFLSWLCLSCPRFIWWVVSRRKNNRNYWKNDGINWHIHQSKNYWLLDWTFLKYGLWNAWHVNVDFY